MGEFLSRQELLDLGFRSVGERCRVSGKCSFYAIDGVIGNNVRIDDFCVIKGKVSFLSHNHISAFSLISGAQAPVLFKEFSFLSARCTVYTGSDDYRANALPGATAPPEYARVRTGPVTLGVNAWVGAHCLLLPGVTVGDGASVGAGCVIASDVGEGAIMRTARPRLELDYRRRDVDKMKELAVRVLENEAACP